MTNIEFTDIEETTCAMADAGMVEARKKIAITAIRAFIKDLKRPKNLKKLEADLLTEMIVATETVGTDLDAAVFTMRCVLEVAQARLATLANGTADAGCEMYDATYCRCHGTAVSRREPNSHPSVPQPTPPVAAPADSAVAPLEVTRVPHHESVFERISDMKVVANVGFPHRADIVAPSAASVDALAVPINPFVVNTPSNIGEVPVVADGKRVVPVQPRNAGQPVFVPPVPGPSAPAHMQVDVQAVNGQPVFVAPCAPPAPPIPSTVVMPVPPALPPTPPSLPMTPTMPGSQPVFVPPPMASAAAPSSSPLPVHSPRSASSEPPATPGRPTAPTPARTPTSPRSAGAPRSPFPPAIAEAARLWRAPVTAGEAGTEEA